MKKHYLFFSEGSIINQVICAVLVNFPLFVYGSTIGWMSPNVLLLQSEYSPTGEPLSIEVISWMGSAPYLLCVPADFLMAYLGDKLGRKITVIIISVFSAACWIVKLSSMETWAFIFARCLVGVSMAGCFVICSLYTKEICQDSIRGVMGTLVVFFNSTGNLFSYIIGDMLSYRMVLWVCLALPTIHLILFLMMPESPAYLIKNGRKKEALRILAWLKCRDEDDPDVQTEVNKICKEQTNDEGSSNFALKSMLQDNLLRRALTIVLIVTMAREVCGAIPVLNYAGDIFSLASQGTGLVLTPNQQAMALGSVQVTGCLISSSLVERTGRKGLLVVSSLVSGLSMCVLATWFLLRDYSIFAPEWLPILTLCMSIFCDAAGLMPVSMVITSEMFSYKYRSTVFAIVMSAASMLAFLQMLLFKPVANFIGIHAAFYCFGVICLAHGVFAIVKVPETKKRTLEEIQEKLKTKKERQREQDEIKMSDAEK